MAEAGALSGEGVGRSPASGSRHRMAQALRQHFLLSAHWSSLEHSLLSKQGAEISGACTWGQRPAFCAGAGERGPALQAPGLPCSWCPGPQRQRCAPRAPREGTAASASRSWAWATLGGGGRASVVGRQGNGLTAGWSLGAWGGGSLRGVWVPTQGGPWTKLAPPTPRQASAWGTGAAVLPMKGTMQERLQGLLGQHLVPRGQLSSELQETVQASSSEELSSGHMACPAHRTGRWVGGPVDCLHGGCSVWGEVRGGESGNQGESGPQYPNLHPFLKGKEYAGCDLGTKGQRWG